MKFAYKDWTLVGLIDSDGSFTIRLNKRKEKLCGMGVTVEIGQKTLNREVVEIIRKQLGSTVKLIVGSFSKLGIAFGSRDGAGDKLRKILAKHKPLAPTKRRDSMMAEFIYSNYSIARGAKSFSTWTFKELSSIDLPDLKKQKIGSYVAVILAYNTSNELYCEYESKKKEKSIEDWQSFLEISPEEKAKAEQIAQIYLDQVDKAVENLKRFLLKPGVQLPKAYLVGYHIGDGCLTCSPRFKQSASTGLLGYRLEVSFYLDEAPKNYELLVAMCSTFKQGSVINRESNNSIRYKLTGFIACWQVVTWLLDGYHLPEFRMHQYRVFKEVLIMGLLGRVRTYGRFKYIAQKMYYMNQDGEFRRESLDSWLYNARAYFTQENPAYFARKATKIFLENRKYFQNSAGSLKSKAELQQNSKVAKKREFSAEKLSLFDSI